MPSINSLKDLYKAKSLLELESKANLPPSVKTSKISSLIESSHKLCVRADQLIQEGDEEMAYIMLTKFQLIFQLIRDADRNEYLRELGSHAIEVLRKLEMLKKSLSHRYKEKEIADNNRKSLAFNQTQQPVSGNESARKSLPDSGSPVSDDNCDIYQTIDPQALVEVIESPSQLESILIIDIRPEEQFKESAISAAKLHVKTVLHVMNIPKDRFHSGMSYSMLEKNLRSLGFLKHALDQRNIMKYIVIVDADDCPAIDDYQSKPSVILADILYKWDHLPNKVKTKPKILKGGFEGFLYCYPTYVTDSNVINKIYKSFNINGNDKASLKGLYDYDKKEETVIVKPLEEQTKEPDSHSPATGQSGALPYCNGFIANNGFSDIPSSIKFPGSAKPVIPDRSSKPSILPSSPTDVEMRPVNNLKPILVNSKRDNIPSHMNGLDGDQLCNNHVDDSDDEMVVGEFDDIHNRKPCPPTPQQKRKEFINDTEMLDLDDDVKQQPDHLNRSNPISMPKRNGHHPAHFMPSSSLSRSLSSPNVAQFDEMQSPFNSVGSKVSNGTPFIDRSMKPQIQFQKRNDFPHKEREFAPQYTTHYGLPIGLKNLGNTCFMNAVLACLNNTTELTNYIRSGPVHINRKSKFGTNGELANEFLELIKMMRFPSTYKCISPKNFKDAVNEHIPDFYDYKQQDAHEFLVRFFDRLHSDLNSNENCVVEDPTAGNPNFYDSLSHSAAAKCFWNYHLSRNDSIISRLFDGLILGVLKCLDCGYTSKSLEAFTCLSLPVQEGSGRTSIQTSLRNFLKTEKIEAEWHCPACRDKRSAEKSTFILKYPKYLVIHLKRFSYEGLWRQKITTAVDFPIDSFRLDTTDNSSRCYDLYGVVNHTGSLEGGHYVAHSRCIGHFDWHRFDDSDVTPIKASEVVTPNAYVLFYKCRDN